MALSVHSAPRSIYLADDDSDDRDFFTDAIREIHPGVVLKVAQDGVELIDNLLALSGAELPDFIFLDINMPRKSGLECLEEIRNHKGGLKKVNVVMLSTSSDPQNIQRARQMGAAFYAVKPGSFEKLKSLLGDILNRNLSGALEANRQFLFE